MALNFIPGLDPEARINLDASGNQINRLQYDAAGKPISGSPAGSGTVPKPTTMMGRIGAEFPTIKRGLGAIPDALARMRGAVPSWMGSGAVGGGVAGALSAVPEVIGAMDVANDPNTTKLDVGTRIGEGMFRTGMTGLGAGIGAVAGGGLASIPLAAAMGYGGNKLADWLLSMRGDSTPAAPTAPTAAPTGPVGPAVSDYGRLYDRQQATELGTGSNQTMEGASGAAGETLNRKVAPWTAADIRGTRIPERGTGAIQVGNGPVRTIDTRPTGAGAVAPVADGSVGSYVGALMNQRQAGLTAQREAATYKVNTDAAARFGASASQAGINSAVLAEYNRAKAAGLSPAELGAILGKHPPPAEYRFPDTGMPIPGDKNPRAIRVSRGGEAESVPVRTQVRGYQGTDGSYYKRSADGKDVKMTDAEKAQFLTQRTRGPGAVQ